MANEQPTTDEINVVRLLRRLEKTIANEEEWTPNDGVPVEDVVLRVRKTLQVSNSIEAIWYGGIILRVRAFFFWVDSEICKKAHQDCRD